MAQIKSGLSVCGSLKATSGTAFSSGGRGESEGSQAPCSCFLWVLLVFLTFKGKTDIYSEHVLGLKHAGSSQFVHPNRKIWVCLCSCVASQMPIQCRPCCCGMSCRVGWQGHCVKESPCSLVDCGGLALLTLHFGFLPGTDLVPSYSPREIGLAYSAEGCCSQLDSWLDSIKFHCVTAPPPVVIWCWGGGGGKTCQLL